MDHEMLNLSRRKMIFNQISKYPGTYIREMEKALSLSIGDLQYHLQQLEKADLISSHDDGRRKRYFIKNEVNYFDREILSFIKMRTPRRIIIFLMIHPESSFKEILAEFNFTKGALSFHLKKLIKANIVINTKREKEMIYRIKDENKISQILITYQSGILDEALNGFIDIWTKL
ncbi:MAG: ArsR family transcriptional regulator [Candidatus Thermoplasmatota archaeon]|nr:ArsR family transcriptional regulator [Candidatus Thermoplasmatota archaeon]